MATTTANIIEACRAMGHYQFESKSSYPDNDAQRNLDGRTHYADPDTLRYFKARILRGTHSANGLFYLLQESLQHPEYSGRVRRNVLFDVFGNVVGGREVFHKTARAADAEYSELRAWMDNEANAATVGDKLRERIESAQRWQAEALARLNGETVEG